jgi:hypothetical protein
MLEVQTLLLVRERDPAGARAVVDAATGARLGSVRPAPANGRPWWRRLAGPAVEVREHEDEPLLFTVRRAWALAPRFEVLDADGCWIGTLQGPYLEDRYGRRLAAVWPGQSPGVWVVRGSEGRELAVLLGRGGGVEVRFTEAVEAEPFAKMMLLAAALRL